MKSHHRKRIRALVALATAPLLAAGTLTAFASTAHAQADFRALLFTRAVGYVHDSIPAGIQMFEEEAAEQNIELVQTDDPAVFNDAELAGFDVVIMLQNSGMVWDTDEQRQAMQDYVTGGGGVVALHNSLDAGIEGEFPWWDETINGGAHMPGHAVGPQNGTVHIEDPDHPSTQGLPEAWDRSEEWYNFDPNPRPNVHVLATVDESTYDPGEFAMGEDHPISWCSVASGGKVWATAMGHYSESYSEEGFRDHVMGGVQWASGNKEGDCGQQPEEPAQETFEKVTLDDDTSDPMELDVAPDGRVFYIQRGGDLRVFDPETNSTTTAGSVDVYTGGEDGLIGLALDPDFATTNRVYLNYSPAGSAEDINRVSAFTMNGNTLDVASEEVVIDIPAYRDRTFPEPGHTGGSIEFGPDGTLYIGVGDDTAPNLEANWQGYAPLDWRPGHEMQDAARTAGNTNDLRGKILRIQPTDGGGYSIPEGNLFPEGTEKTLPEIYAMGFRNSFRFTADPATGDLYVADYGPDRDGPTDDRGPTGMGEFNVITEPGNFGWPFCHGDNQPYAPYNPDTGEIGPKFDCANPVNESPNNTGLTELPPVQMPEVWYGNSASAEFPELGSGGVGPMGGPVYRYDADNPSTTKFPQSYDGAAFFGEWTRNYIKDLRFGDGGGLESINDFMPGTSFIKPMDMTFGPDGALYLLEWGSAFGGGNDDSGLYRIEYGGAAGQPVAHASASVTSGPAPLEVVFSSEGSEDPDGGELTYEWDFDGDGTYDSTEAGPTHTYETAGDLSARLRVTDPDGLTAFDNLPITVGNTAPTVALSTPVNGTPIDFGDEISYEVTVTDPEDGEIDCENVIVNPALGHNDHEHPTTDLHGCSGTVDTGDLGGHPEGANLYYVLNAEYTDQGAEGTGQLTGYARGVLQPRHKQAEYRDSQSGTRIVAQDGAENGQRIGDISDGDWIAFKFMSVTGVGSVSYRLSSPDGGGAIELRADAPDGELLATTEVPATGGWNTYATTDPAEVAGLDGTHTLYVVFTTAQNNSYDVDAVEFQAT
jgi:cytochrome c